MKIEGMDASNIRIPAQSQSQPQAQVSTVNTENTNDNAVNSAENNIDTRNISHLSDYEKRELPISEKAVINAIEKANKAISGANRVFEFSIHEKTKEIMIKVVNSETKEVIREIPPEKILDMIAKMWEMAGIMVDERR